VLNSLPAPRFLVAQIITSGKPSAIGIVNSETIWQRLLGLGLVMAPTRSPTEEASYDILLFCIKVNKAHSLGNRKAKINKFQKFILRIFLMTYPEEKL
jgi:hypothetical protein